MILTTSRNDRGDAGTWVPTNCRDPFRSVWEVWIFFQICKKLRHGHRVEGFIAFNTNVCLPLLCLCFVLWLWGNMKRKREHIRRSGFFCFFFRYPFQLLKQSVGELSRSMEEKIVKSMVKIVIRNLIFWKSLSMRKGHSLRDGYTTLLLNASLGE